MGAIDDVFGSNERRPDSPDFWRLSSVYLKHDGAVDEAPDADKERVWRGIITDLVEMEALVYTAEQRVIRALGEPSPASIVMFTRAVALVIDGMIGGMAFQKEGGKRGS